MASNLAASSENDKHALASIPLQMPGIVPASVSTTHDFYFTGGYPTQGASNYTKSMYSGAGTDSFEFMQLNLNNLMTPIRGFTVLSGPMAGATGFGNNQSNIFNAFADSKPYVPQGVNLHKNRYKYYKIDQVDFQVTVRNIAGLDAENAIAPVTLHCYHQNNTNFAPLFTQGATPEARLANVAALMMNPNVTTLCNGQILGHTGVAGYSGIASQTTPFPYAPELTTSFTYKSANSIASDPNIDTNVKYWISTAGSGAPANENFLRFFAVSASATNYIEGQGKFRPEIVVKARYKVTWRDHNGNSPMYTSLNLADGTGGVPS